MSRAWPSIVDGVLSADGQITVATQGGGFSSGEGLFETFVLNGKRAEFWTLHWTRLSEAARDLELLPAPSRVEWESDLAELARIAAGASLAVRLVLFRDGSRVRRVVTATDLPLDVGHAARVGRADPSVDGPRTLARWKTLNYLASRRAHLIGSRRGLDEVLFTRSDGTVLEGSRSSVFLVKDGVLRTAPKTLPILPGVTRQVLLEEARAADLAVLEEPFRILDFGEASEAFLSGGVRGVRPILTFEGATIGAGSHPIADLLGARYLDRRVRDAETVSLD